MATLRTRVWLSKGQLSATLHGLYIKGNGNLLDAIDRVWVVEILEHGGQTNDKLMGVVHPGPVQKRVLRALNVTRIACGMQLHGGLEGSEFLHPEARAGRRPVMQCRSLRAQYTQGTPVRFGP